jgi:hypothetical protein
MFRQWLFMTACIILLSACAKPGTPGSDTAKSSMSQPESSAKTITGVWRDTETQDLIKVELKNGAPTVVSIVSDDDGEVQKLISSKWEKGVLSWTYDVPSTGYRVNFQTTSIAQNLLQTTWQSGPNTAPPTDSGEQELTRETGESKETNK